MAVIPLEERFSDFGKSCADSLYSEGYTLLGRVLSEEDVAKVRAEFDRRYSHLSRPGAKIDNSLKTGGRRYQLIVELSGAFGDPVIYANPRIMEVLNIVFDQKFVLESFGTSLSLPGAETQHTHRDGVLYGPPVDALLPPYAVTVGIPLVDMTLQQGTTEIIPGSHRWKEPSSSIVPEVAAGSGMMWDYRTLHRGTENQSDRYRPLLYFTYGKPWWRDTINFDSGWTKSRLSFGKDFFKTVPGESRFLFKNVDQ